MKTETVPTPLQQQLFALQDPGYRSFHCRLIPNIDPARVIGVRTPALRRFAAGFAKTPQAAPFLAALPHFYYEENNLHGILLCGLRDFEAAVAALDDFLPWVDNWATCDLLAPKSFAACPPRLPALAAGWMAASHPYTVRFGIGVLMRYYLDSRFSPAYPAQVAALQSEEYYVRMMAAWYFATALAKQYEAILPFFTENRLPVWVHNKAIQKAVESYRIPPEHKAALRALRRKGGQGA